MSDERQPDHWKANSPTFGLEGSEIELLEPLDAMYRPRHRTLSLAQVARDAEFFPRCVDAGLEVTQDHTLGLVFVVSRAGIFPEFLMAYEQLERERPC